MKNLRFKDSVANKSKGLLLRHSLEWRDAPASRSLTAMSKNALDIARCRGVYCRLFLAKRSAPDSMSLKATSSLFNSTARRRGDMPSWR